MPATAVRTTEAPVVQDRDGERELFTSAQPRMVSEVEMRDHVSERWFEQQLSRLDAGKTLVVLMLGVMGLFVASLFSEFVRATLRLVF